MTPEQRQRVIDRMERDGRQHDYPTYHVDIFVDDGRQDTQIVKAADEWKARTIAMMLTTLELSGQLVTYDVVRLFQEAPTTTTEEEVAAAERLERLPHGSNVERAIWNILNFGSLDGAHHKQWLLDQSLRLLCGEEYSATVLAYELISGAEWDTGVAP